MPIRRALLLLAPLVAASVAAGCGRSSSSPVDRVAAARQAQAERVARDAGLSPDVQRFLGRAAAAVRHTFTVTYQGPGAGRTTLAQRPPDRRIDVAGDGTESLFRLGSGTFACRRPSGAEAKWTCSKQATSAAGPDPDLGVFSPTRLAATVEALGAARGAYAVAVVRRPVAGTSASCLVATPKKGAPDELCIAPDGAVLRIKTAQQTLEALRYRNRVDAKAFTLPAPAR